MPLECRYFLVANAGDFFFWTVFNLYFSILFCNNFCIVYSSGLESGSVGTDKDISV